VTAVSFQLDSPFPVTYGELLSLVTVHVGDNLSEEGLRASIRGLYSKQTFREVSAYVREELGGAEVKFHLSPVPEMVEVEVRGNRTVPTARYLSALRFRKGSTVTATVLEEGEEAIRALLLRLGYPGPSVKARVSCAFRDGTAGVLLEVEEGKAGVVRELSFPGATRLPPARLRELSGIREGERLDFRDMEKGAGRLLAGYKRSGCLAARLRDTEVRRLEEGEVSVSVPVEEGPVYEVRWSGNRRFSTRRLEEASDLYGTGKNTEAGFLYDARERLLAFYRERGYHEAVVRLSTGEELPNGTIPLDVEIREGVPVHIAAIRFEGNRGVSSSTLRSLLLTRERGPFHLLTGSGSIDAAEWEGDLDTVVGYYQKNGYVNARIASMESEISPDGAESRTVHVEEGRRYEVRGLRFRGNDHFLESELLPLVGNRPGKPVDFAGLDREGEAVAAWYRNRGYLEAKVAASLDYAAPDDGMVVVEYRISEGVKYRLGKMVVRGNVLTRDRVVARELSLAPGDAAGEADLLKFQQAVYATGLFRRVRLQQVRRPAEGVVDLVVEVEEGNAFEVEFGPGYGTDTGLRAVAGAKHIDLDGFGRSLSGRLLVAQRETNVVGNLREPWIFGNRWKWDGELTGSYQEAQRESFDLRKAAVVAGVRKNFPERSSAALQYEFSRDEVFHVKPDVVLSKEDQGSARIGAVRALGVLDLRDDPFNPRRGALNSATVELALLGFGSEVEFWRATAQSSWYLSFARRHVVAFSLRGGAARALGGTVEVPIQKRFFLGGRTTVRGFREEALGPKGVDGNPTGGDYMVNGNVELRVTLAHGFLVDLFLDGGSVWLRGGPPGSGFDLRESTGAGIRYITPIGPMGFDWGWKISPRQGESRSEWHFTIGAVF
jgi:outer membrane protein insertion porin family